MDEHPDSSDSRRKRIRVAMRLVAALFVAALALGATYWLMRPEEGRILGIVPISDDESFVLMQTNYETGPSRGWLIRVRKDGHRVFTTELPAPPDTTGNGHGLVTDGRVVVVLTNQSDERTTIVALDAHSGDIKWKLGQAGRSLNGIFLTADDFVGVFDGEQYGPAVIGLSLADGTRHFAHRPADDIGVAVVDEARSLLAYRDDDWRVLSLRNGPAVRDAVRAPIGGDACLLDRALYGVSDDLLVRTVFRDSVLTTETHPIAPREPAIGYAQTCGARGDALVFFGQKPATREAFVWITDKDGAVHRRIDLGVSELWRLGGERDKGNALYDPLRGSLSRFVPVLLMRGENTFVLVVLDLERGEIAWTSAIRNDLVQYQVVRGRDHVHYLAADGHIVAIDGTNGRVLAAVSTSMRGMRGFYATAHTLWGFSSQRSNFDTLPFVTLDARTLARRTWPNAESPTHNDVLARTLTWLAVPAAYRP